MEQQSFEEDIKKTIFRRFEGIKNKDESVIRSVVDEDYSKFDDWSPFKRQETDEALKNEFNALKILTDYTYETKDLKVTIYGDVALVTFYIRYQGKLRDRPFNVVSRVTTVLRRRESLWKIVHEHLSRFPEQREPRFSWF